MKKFIFLTLILSLFCCNHKQESKQEKIRKAAEHGDAKAQFNLGNMYYEGKGVTKDDAQAAAWYRKAAEQGDANAQNNLGMMYDIGLGVTKDYAQAAVWFRKAAEQGDANAQFMLGDMYENGKGVPKDYVQAYKYFNMASAQGDSTASEIRDLLEKKMTPEQIAKAQEGSH